MTTEDRNRFDTQRIPQTALSDQSRFKHAMTWKHQNWRAANEPGEDIRTRNLGSFLFLTQLNSHLHPPRLISLPSRKVSSKKQHLTSSSIGAPTSSTTSTQLCSRHDQSQRCRHTEPTLLHHPLSHRPDQLPTRNLLLPPPSTFLHQTRRMGVGCSPSLTRS